MTLSVEKNWMLRARFLTQALLLSGMLNIGLLSAVVYSALQEKIGCLSYEAPEWKSTAPTIRSLLETYSKASFAELLSLLEQEDAVEVGYKKRDLALACLVAYHHFALDRALGGMFLQKRLVTFSKEGKEVDILLFAGLEQEHFAAIREFAKVEKWPFTPEGLFVILQQSSSKDPSLVEAWYCTAESHALQALLQKNIPQISSAEVFALLQEGKWSLVKLYADKVQFLQSYDAELCYELLSLYVVHAHSSLAARYLAVYGGEYAVKKLEDIHLLRCLSFLSPQEGVAFAKALLVSPRTDEVRKSAAAFLYQAENLAMPEPYEYMAAVYHFFPEKVAQPPSLPVSRPPASSEQSTHVVQAGDSLWKIARKYKVSIEAIKQANHLETDRLKLGKELQIPASR